MKLYSLLTVDYKFEDDRGRLTQLFHSGYSQVNVLETKKGVIRGGHFHKNTIEVFYIIRGRIKVKFSKNDEIAYATFSDGDYFQVSTNVIHEMEFLDDTLMVAAYNKPIENMLGNKDIYK